MTTFHNNLPPLLEQELGRILRRYRAIRWLRATWKFLVLIAPVLGLALAASRYDLPVSTPLAAVIGACCTIAAGAWAFAPLLARPATLRDIAGYIDRTHPALQDRILSAVALTESAQEPPSAWMLENFLAETQLHVKGVPLDDFMNPREFRLLAGGVSLGAVSCGILLLAAGWNSGLLRDMAAPHAERAAVEFKVDPGNATVLPGDNQIIWVTTPDTGSTKYIYWEVNGVEQRAALQPSTTPEVSFHTFLALQEGLHYQVRVARTTSERFEIRVKRPPGVESIQVRYEYPDYLGLEPSVAPYSGEISAVQGTRVTVRVEASKPLESARLVRESGVEHALAAAGENYWETAFTLEQSDRYHVALRDTEGEENPDPEEHPIHVTPDNPPQIRVKFPRGDAKVLALEEVPFAFEVEDDFGVEAYGIEYALAGRDPVRLAFNTPGPTLQQAAANHLLALEDLGLSDGDLVTWTVWATDKKPDRADYEVTGDPYFLEVRPYTLRYREQISQGGGMGAEMGGGEQMVVDQKKIIIALSNLRKSASTLSEAPYTEREGELAQAQTGIRERLTEAMAAMETEQQTLAEGAVKAMNEVEAALGAADWPEPEAALGDGIKAAQRAWQALLKLEPDLRQVARQEGGGQGGGSAGQQELDALEMGQRKDYREEATTGAEQSARNEAVRNALEDLARRQEMLNEDIGKLLSEDEKAQEALEKKRQLERLQEEQERQLERLDELRNQVASSQMSPEQRQDAGATMDQARRDMERSMEAVRGEQLQQARASGSRAVQNLQEAESTLEQLTREGARERFAALEEQLKTLGERQNAIQQETGALKEEQAAPGVEGQERWAERMETLKEDKRAMAEATREMLEGAGGLSDQLRENQELLSRKLGDWVRKTSRTGVVEDIEESMEMVEYGVWDAAERQETQVKNKIDEAARTLQALRPYLPGEGDDSMERALDMLTQLEGMGGKAATNGEQPGEGDRGEEQSAAGRPGESANGTPQDSEQGDGQPVGQQTGEQTGEQQAREQQPGTQPGEAQAGTGQPGQPGDASQSAGGTGPPGEQQANAEGSPQPPQNNAAPPGSGSPTGGNTGGDGAAAATWGGGRSLGEFFDGELKDWRPVLRDAASLLPRESRERQSLEQVDMDLGRLQRQYDHEKKLPEIQEFEQVVRRPLMDTIATLEELVRAKAEDKSAWLEDEGAIPVQYVDRVAEYFRLLAGQPATP